MVDNLELNAGSGGAKIATDDDGTAHHQYIKLEFGADNTQTKVSTANPLPVQIGDGTDNALVSAAGALVVDGSAVTQPVSGTVTADLGATDNAVLDDIAAKLGTIDNVILADDADFTATSTPGVPVQGVYESTPTSVTDGDLGVVGITQTRALRTAIEGTVTVGSHAVTNAGTFAVQESGGALTALQIIDDWDESDRAKVNAQQVSGVMIENAVEVTVKYAVIDAATSGDNTIVAAVAGKKIRVLSLFLVASGTVTVRFESGASGTALTGQMNLVANTGFALNYNPHGHFQSGEGALLNLELSGAVSVDGSLTYIEAE